jgi:hypothetical protein
MKQTILVLLLSALSLPAFSRTFTKSHILPDAPGWEYQGHYVPETNTHFIKPDGIASAVQLGERNLAWLKHMNSFRPEGQKLQLTKPGDLKGIPIESPKLYNADTVTKEYQNIESTMPEALKAVLYSAGNLPNDIPVDEATYVLWANKVDKNYQTAVRWKMMVPWLAELEQERQNDLRGFYFLSKKTENVEDVLKSLDGQPADRQKEIRGWLVQMCFNNLGLHQNCEGVVDASIKSKKAYELYVKYLPTSQELWDSYFSLHNPRHEIVWTSADSTKMSVPFADPNDPKISDFLKVNIEDEWKWDGWHLILDFQKSADIHVEFQPGVTPHVNDLGGNTITMDNNAPLTEWDVQWTIRHEFGHVLGFEDCYLEFYEPSEAAIISYQLDIDNLMCARSGRMQQTHYETLKASYLKN